MENTQAPIQKSPLNVLNPPEFQEIDTISFLTDLYSYPPKFNVSVGETNVNNFNGQLKNKTRPANSLRVLENKLSYKITDYISIFMSIESWGFGNWWLIGLTIWLIVFCVRF